MEVSPFWQQKKLVDLCKQNGILITAYSPLGAIGTFYGSNRILESEVLQEIAKSKGKSIPQVLAFYTLYLLTLQILYMACSVCICLWPICVPCNLFRSKLLLHGFA